MQRPARSRWRWPAQAIQRSRPGAAARRGSGVLVVGIALVVFGILPGGSGQLNGDPDPRATESPLAAVPLTDSVQVVLLAELEPRTGGAAPFSQSEARQGAAATAAEPAMAQGLEPPDPSADAGQRLREAALTPFRELDGRFGIAVKDLGSGQAVLLNETAAFPAASLYKLPIMAEVFRLQSEGSLSFAEELVMGAADAAYDLGTPAWPIGTRISLGDAVDQMITLSDNSSAVMLTRRVNAGRVNETMVRLGLDQTHVRLDDLATSPRDMLRLLELLAEGRLVDAPASAEMVRLLARQQVRDRIPAQLPAEATAANKTGNWGSAAHDVGLVYGPRATLALAFLSDGITDREAVYAAMARAARDVYDLANDPAFVTWPFPPAP